MINARPNRTSRCYH